MTFDASDIQGDILRGYRHAMVSHQVLEVRDRTAARAFWRHPSRGTTPVCLPSPAGITGGLCAPTPALTSVSLMKACVHWASPPATSRALLRNFASG
jgi:hypothetical protein